MIEIVPFMLFILSWHPNAPDNVELQRVEGLFVDEGQCDRVGATKVGELESSGEGGNTRYEYRCVELPKREEFGRLRRELRSESQ